MKTLIFLVVCFFSFNVFSMEVHSSIENVNENTLVNEVNEKSIKINFKRAIPEFKQQESVCISFGYFEFYCTPDPEADAFEREVYKRMNQTIVDNFLSMLDGEYIVAPNYLAYLKSVQKSAMYLDEDQYYSLIHALDEVIEDGDFEDSEGLASSINFWMSYYSAKKWVVDLFS